MAKKPFKPPRIAPLQRIRAESITDPEEQARLDELYKEYKREREKLERELEARMLRKSAELAAKARAKKKK